MRIDDENKMVVPDFVTDYIEKHYDDKAPTSWDRADLLRDWDNYISVSDRNDIREWLKNADNFLKFVIAIATDNYTVVPQKYYWRKKKEHLASFEDEQYLFADEHEKTTVTSIAYASKFDETELMNVIGSVDFDKFEKVECG